VVLIIGIIAFIIVYIYQRILTANLYLIGKIFYLFVFTLILAGGIYFREKTVPKDSVESAVLSPIVAPINSGVNAIKNAVTDNGLESAVLPLVQNEQGTYAIGIKNLKTDQTYYYNENHEFETASLYKLWIMAEVYQQIAEGKLSLNQTLSDDVEDLNQKFDIDDSDAEQTEGTVTDTIEGALNKMITISDNYSALLLSANVGLSNVSQFLKDNNFPNSSVGTPPQSNVIDIMSFYQKLYDKKLISQNASNQMLELLKQQAINDRIPKYLPENTVVAHKTGEIDGVKHDAGIVFSKNGDYIIVLMSDTNDQTHAAEVEANISKVVWDYFNK
jgi:beta-lactamase class A